MNLLIKKTIIFFIISIFASSVIYNIIPSKQNIHISVYSKPELLLLSKELLNISFENRIMVKHFKINYEDKQKRKQIELYTSTDHAWATQDQKREL
jgi:hypothetical protein